MISTVHSTGTMWGIKEYLLVFRFMWPCRITTFFIIKPTRCTNFRNLLRHEILHVSDSSSAHHQEFIHCTLGTGICHTDFEDSFRAGPGPARKLSSKPVWHTPLLNVQWINSCPLISSIGNYSLADLHCQYKNTNTNALSTFSFNSYPSIAVFFSFVRVFHCCININLTRQTPLPLLLFAQRAIT